MSNQKITQLRTLTEPEVNPFDLFIIVDRDTVSSATGETKNITISELTSYVQSHITPGNTDEQSVYQPLHGLFVGATVRVDTDTQTYVTSSANSSTGKEAEVVGVVRSIVDQDNFIVVFGGAVNFTSNPTWAPSGLEVGKNYFLYDNGMLINQDPTDVLHPDWVSKPVLTAVESSRAVLDKQRGFFRPGSEELTGIKLYVTSSNQFLVGDVIRKTVEAETASLGDWTLASAESYASSQVVGVITECSSNYFIASVAGKVKNLSNLSVGDTYYLATSESFDFSGSRETQRNVLGGIPECSSVIKPIYIAISPTEAVIVNSSLNPYDVNSCNLGLKPYGPFPYISDSQPLDSDVESLANSILPNAKVNETSIVYWMKDIPSTQYSANPKVRVVWNLVKIETGWKVG